MKLSTIRVGEEVHTGCVTEGRVFDLTRASLAGLGDFPQTLDDALFEWEESMAKASAMLARVREDQLLFEKASVPLGKAEFLPPVVKPGKILCVFVNYRSHGQEVGTAPSEPVFFFKHSNSLVGDGEDVLVPKFSVKPDHEVELGVVIGRTGKDIPTSRAYDHVAGYTVLNDVSFRDGMRRGVEGTVLGRNLFRGKVADTALPMGPYLVTKDELPDPYPLAISLKVNGETRQSGTTDDMIFKIPQLIAAASEDITLLPGDVLATGTCSGVGLYTGKYLQDGDLMEAGVEKVGILRNRVRFQTRA